MLYPTELRAHPLFIKELGEFDSRAEWASVKWVSKREAAAVKSCILKLLYRLKTAIVLCPRIFIMVR